MLNELSSEESKWVEKAKESIQGYIKCLPDNPRIRRLSKNAFVIMSRDLGDVWSPEYHDFQWQYRQVLLKLENASSITGFRSTLSNIVTSGVIAVLSEKGAGSQLNEVGRLRERLPRKVVRRTSTPYKQKLHPEVLQNLRVLLS